MSSIILSLLTANSKFPDDFDYQKASVDIKNFVNKCECLHKAVDVDNFDVIKSKLASNPTLIHFYDRNSQSLLAHALKSKKLKIVELLDKGISTGAHEDLKEVYEGMFKKDFRVLRNQHKVNARESKDTHIFILKSKSKIGNNDPFSHTKWNYIKEAFATLNRNEYCQKILKIAAECKKLKIYFDFKHDSTYYMDPATSYNSKGIIYACESIFIGAKNLTESVGKYEVFGVLAHELCHLAVFMAYMNRDFDPFPIGDSKEKKRFIEQVMKQCKMHQKREQMVKNVYESYEENLQTSEMIVTVPQMQMEYLKNSRRLKKSQLIFKNLFKYSKEVVEPELDRALPILKMLASETQTVKFQDLTQPMKAKILHFKINFQGLETSFYELIGNDHKILNLLLPESIHNVLMKNEVLEIGKECEQIIKNELTQRSFIELKTCKVIQNLQHIVRQEDIEKIYLAYSSTFNDIKNEVEESKIFLLADHAGTGKTTIFEDISIKLKKNHQNYWVSCINLRKHEKTFDEFNNLAENLNIDDVIKILLKIVDQTSELESKIFSKLFHEGKTILLFEGVDEISPKYTKLLTRALFLLKEFKIKNQLWISTRPHLAKVLKKMLDCQAFQFAPYTTHQKENLIKKILESKSLNDPQKEHKIANEVHQYILQRQWSSSKHQSIDNSLMISMITELHIQNAIDVNTSSHYGIYWAMFKKQIEEIDEKIPVNERNPFESFSILKVHQVLALKLIVGDDLPNFKLDDLVIVKEWNCISEKSPDKIQRYGFVTVDMDNPDERTSIDFIHRTFAEFFVAMFIICSVFDDNFGDRDEEIVKKFELLKIILKNRFSYFSMVKLFIISYIKNEAKIGKKSFHKKIKSLLIQEFCKFHDGSDLQLNYDFYNYVDFSLIDENLSKMLWKCGDCLKGCIKDYRIQNYYNILSLAEMSFGLNWHENFNKSGKSLVSDQEIEQKYNNGTKSFCYSLAKNLLKFCDLVDQNYTKEDKVKFYDSLKLDLGNDEYKNVKNEILLRMSKHAHAVRLVDECFELFDDFASLTFYANLIKQGSNFDKNSVKLRMKVYIPSIYLTVCQSSGSGRYETFKQFLTEYYTKAEIQEILVNSHEIDFFEGCENNYYEEYKQFIKFIFKPNGFAKVASKIERLSKYTIILESYEKGFVLNTFDFISLVFSKRKSKIGKIFKRLNFIDLH